MSLIVEHDVDDRIGQHDVVTRLYQCLIRIMLDTSLGYFLHIPKLYPTISVSNNDIVYMIQTISYSHVTMYFDFESIDRISPRLKSELILNQLNNSDK